MAITPGKQSATVVAVASSASAVTLVAAGTGAGQQRIVFNDSSASLFIKFGSGASASDFTVKLAAGAYYEFPIPLYMGIVTGIWDAANGFARITSY